jgi:hypothetical protein
MQVSENVSIEPNIHKNVILDETIITILNESKFPSLIQTSTGMEPIINIWTLLNDIGNITGMPERFTAVIMAYSQSKDYEYAINEWSVINVNSSEYTEQCICSHKIEINNYVRNNINGNVLIIGSECINKFGSGNMKTNLRIVSNIRKYTGTKRMCQRCCKHKIPGNAEDWKTLCRSCYKKGERTASEEYKQVMGYRQCKQCKKFSISKDAEDWKMVCNSCYSRILTERVDDCKNIGYRSCQQFKKLSIPEDAEDWKTLCNLCYNRKILGRFDHTGEIKKVECRQCQTCNKSNIPKNEPGWKLQCLDCYRLKK